MKWLRMRVLVLYGPCELMLLYTGEEPVELRTRRHALPMWWDVLGHLAEERRACVVGEVLHAIVLEHRVLLAREPGRRGAGEWRAAVLQADTSHRRRRVEERGRTAAV